MPAQAGIHLVRPAWIPAYAGMTDFVRFVIPAQAGIQVCSAPN